jgi:hypothetical protein
MPLKLRQQDCLQERHLKNGHGNLPFGKLAVLALRYLLLNWPELKSLMQLCQVSKRLLIFFARVPEVARPSLQTIIYPFETVKKVFAPVYRDLFFRATAHSNATFATSLAEKPSLISGVFFKYVSRFCFSASLNAWK